MWILVQYLQSVLYIIKANLLFAVTSTQGSTPTVYKPATQASSTSLAAEAPIEAPIEAPPTRSQEGIDEPAPPATVRPQRQSKPSLRAQEA